MNILVIGGAGYIGSHVVKALLQHGDSVTVYDNLSTGCRENVFPECGFIEADILDERRLRAAMLTNGRPVDAVIHLAALKAAGESMLEPERYAEHNIAGTIKILNAMTGADVPRLVFSSSAAVYGEPRYLPIDEAHPTEPTNFYGATKLEIEHLLRWYSHLRELRYAALRYFNAAGYDPDGEIRGLERNPANLLPIIMEVAIGKRSNLQVFGDDYDTADGTGVRDYVHVTDLATAHVTALERIAEHNTDLVLNLGTECGVSVREMYELARTVAERTIPVEVAPRRAGDPAKLVASSAAAREVLGWQPRYSDPETLIRTAWRAYAASGAKSASK